MLSKHEGTDMSEIKWGMFITSYKRTAFERQLKIKKNGTENKLKEKRKLEKN